MRTWKVGDRGWLLIPGEADNPQPVSVEAIDQDGGTPVRVRTKNGSIYYCRHKDLRTRRTRAAGSGASGLSEAQKRAAQEMTERRMKELMDAKKEEQLRQFELIRDGLRCIDQIGSFYEEANGGSSEIWNTVKNLAEAGLFAKAYSD